MLRAAGSVSSGETQPDVVSEVIADQIAVLLDADSCRYVAGPVRDPRLDRDGVLTQHGHEVDGDRRGLPFNEYVAIVVRRGSTRSATSSSPRRFRIAYPSREQRRVAVLLAVQLAGLADVG